MPKDSVFDGFGRSELEGRMSVSEPEAGVGDARRWDLPLMRFADFGLVTDAEGEPGEEGGEKVWAEVDAKPKDFLLTGVEARAERCLLEELVLFES
jgi:hypothetical protein